MQTTGALTNSSSNGTIHLSQEHRSRLYQMVNELTEDQMRVFLVNQIRPMPNHSGSNPFQHCTRIQLIQQAFILIDNYYTPDLENNLNGLSQKRLSNDFRQQQQHQNPQHRLYAAQQQNFNPQYNQNPYYYAQQTVQYTVQPNNYRFINPNNISSQLRPIRPNPNSVVLNNHANHQARNAAPPPPPTAPQPSTYFSARQAFIPHAPTHANSNTNGSTNSNNPPSSNPRYQVPVLPPPPTNNATRAVAPNLSTNVRRSSVPTNQAPRISVPNPTPVPASLPRASLPNGHTGLTITHKTLPFYRPIACIYEQYQIFRYDSYRKHYTSRHEILLSPDVCNQLALSYDYDPDLDLHKTSKCLILRLVRIDQPPMSNGKYDDNLPPNLSIYINGQNMMNLPTPKPCTRQQTDLIRIGREIDITPYVMFNPMLNNELTITWSYRPENTALHSQYVNAQYALHIFLVQHLTIDDLCEHIRNKSAKFHREDLVSLLAKAHAIDRDLGLEVSDQILKLKCPIDQRRLRTPVRATTCQHLQCFDLTNYITMNEKAGKWICPVCNKAAIFDDLQIDTYTQNILHTIENENVDEITIDGELNWTPVATASSSSNIEQKQIKQSNSHMRDIVLDDDNLDEDTHEPIDSKAHIQLITSSNQGPKDLILIDDD